MTRKDFYVGNSRFVLYDDSNNLVVEITYGVESISGSIYMIIDAKKRTTNPFFSRTSITR